VSDLDLLLAEGIIDEICGRLKSGKEADISAVRRGDQILAAKVYKDRATRSFKNNADYKEGRKVRNTRTQRAIDSGGKFGRDSEEQAWKSAEADALYKLVGSGVRVPAPVMFYEGVLLMELVAGVDGQVAPRLIDVAIPPDDAMGIYADLLSQIISMLCCDLIHGDLSPYNILLGADGPTIIDFPQVVSAAHSTRAEFFFLRDFDNVLRFLVGFDPTLAVHRADGRAIWRAYVGRELTPQFVPPPPPPPQQQRRFERRNDRGPRVDNRGPQRSDRSFDPRGAQPRGPQQGPSRNDRPFDSRGSQPRNDGRGPQAPRNDGPQSRDDRPRDDGRGPQGAPRNDRPFDSRGSQPRNDGRGPQAPRNDRPRDDGRGPRNDRSFDSRASQPGDRGPQPPRNDGRGSQHDDGRGPQRPPETGSPQPRRSYGERFAGDRGPGGGQPRPDGRNPPLEDRGAQPRPRSGDDFDWSQPRRTATPPRTDQPGPARPAQRSEQSPGSSRPPPQRPAFSVPPPRPPRARVDPRPPPPSGGHRRRPKRRS
jgi:RIO kinase 1